MDNNTDEMESLYQSFRDSLSNHEELYYEEEDLIDIFDYANEIADTYICNTALSLGQRLYRDSEALRVRQGILYASDIYNERESLHRFMQDNAGRKGTMWDILSLYLIPKEDAAAVDDAFEKFVSTHKLEEDEESVQFYNVVTYHDRTDWLIDNIDRVRKICEYEFTLLFDVAQAARENGRQPLAIKLLDEMTDAEPFSIDLWVLLARTYDDMGQHVEASTALDYARALDQNNMMVRIYECERSMQYDLVPVEKQIELLEAIKNDLPDISFVNSMLVELYKRQGKLTAARELYLPVFEQSPGLMSTLAEILSIDPDAADKYIEMFESAYVGRADDDDEYESESTLPLQMLIVRSISDRHELAYKIVRMLLRIGKSEDAERTYLLALHLSGQNVEAYERFNEMIKDNAIPVEKVLAISPIIGAIMLSAGYVNDAKGWSTVAYDKINDDGAYSYLDAMLMRGILMSLRQIIDSAETWDDLNDEQKANPLNLQLDEAFRDLV